MDIQSNPGPERMENSTNIQSSNSSNRSQNLNNRATNLIKYSSSELFRLRSRHSISNDLYRTLKHLDILRTRGVRPGLAVRNRTYNIFTWSRNREFIQPKTSLKGANLHNICPIKRITENNKPSRLSVVNTSNTGLEIVHLNIRSLKNRAHLTELRQFAAERRSDIITISETWINDKKIKKSELKIEGYKLHRLDRLHKDGGGVCAYVRKELKAKVLEKLSYISERNFHQLWLTVQYKKLKSLVICVSYRPDDSPLSSFEEALKPSYTQALLLNKPIVILGDLNCDCLKKNGYEFKALQKFHTEMNLRQLIEKPTRITKNTETLLDIILVSPNARVRDSGVIHRPISDHSIVFVKLKMKSPKSIPQYVNVRSYKNYCASLFTDDLASKADRLLTIFDSSDLDSKLNTFNEVLQSVLNVHAPIKSIKIRSRPCPFVNQEIKDHMKSRDRLYKRFLQTRDVTDWHNFKESRNSVKQMLLEAERKHTYEEVRLNRNNSSSLWKIINRAIPSKDKERQIYSKDLKTVTNEFNQFFSTVGRKAADASLRLAEENDIVIREPLQETGDGRNFDELFNLRTVTCEEVRRVITSLPLNKSPGPDKVSARIIKDCLPVILGPLTEIINCSILTSTFPANWKEAEVIPILKDGDHEEAANNRPLSLLAVASKVCEKLVLIQFNTYLLSNKRLSSHQSGNKKAHSTETLNIFLTDCILEAIDKKKLTALVLLDLSKAFDSIDHSKLLHKLSKVGASPTVLKWFKSYLSGRCQSVRIDSTLSDPLPITHGVPQGAILSPLMFCIYLNDLPSAPSFCNIESYVDDSKVFLSFPLTDVDSSVEKLEQDLLSVAHWCCDNNLLINPDKTKLLFIGTRQLMSRLPEAPQVSFLGTSLQPAASAKDLGVFLDPHLTYDKHISSVVSSCFSKLYQINRVKESFDKETLKLLITSLVFSKMLYCSSVWSNTSAENIIKLQSIQNFASKIVTNSRKFDHVTPLLRQLNWLPVKQQLIYRDSVMTYKCLNGLVPEYLSNKFVRRSSIHARFTRKRDSLHIPLYKTATGQRTFTYRATSIWNRLDDSIKQSNSLKTFKNAMKEHLHSNYQSNP